MAQAGPCLEVWKSSLASELKEAENIWVRIHPLGRAGASPMEPRLLGRQRPELQVFYPGGDNCRSQDRTGCGFITNGDSLSNLF